MPRVPSVGLSPTSRPQFQAPGVVAFQGGPELQQIARGGARLERIGQIVGQIGIEIEDKVNDARAMEATNAFENSANRLLFDYRQKKGKDAVEARAELDQQMKELRDGAGGMLLNDTQRIQFNRIADKISSRSSLAFDEHYAEAAAEDKQQQNLARQVVVSDSLANNDIGPQSIVAFGQFNNLVREEGEARGLSGDALEVFALGKRDQLLQEIVNAKLNTRSASGIQQARDLVRSLPDGVISQTQKAALTQQILDKSDADIRSQDIVESYNQGDSLQDVYAHADEQLKAGVYTQQEWKKYRDQAAAYYRQQREAENQVAQDLLDEVQSLTDQGQPVPEELKTRAAQLGIKNSFDKIIEGSDDWLPEGRDVWANYEMNPAQALEDFQADPKGFRERLDGMMPWPAVQQIIRGAKAYDAAQSRASGRGSGGSINLVTEREVANGLLQQYAYGFGQKHGLQVYRDNENLSEYQKANIERRWREALQPLVEFEMAKDPNLSVEDAVNKVAPRLWKSGEYSGASDGKPRNKWSEAAYYISPYAANLESEVDDQGRKLVDIAREEIQQERADEALQRRMAREQMGTIPPTPALLGFPEAQAMRSNEEIRQQVMGEMRANMEVFGVPIPSDDTPLYISQEEVYDRVNRMIQENKDQAVAREEKGRSGREQVAIQRLDAMMRGDAFQRAVTDSRNMGFFESIGNEWANFWGPFVEGSNYVPLPTKSPNQMALALEASKTLTVIENGKPVNAFTKFMENGGKEEEWEELVGHHAISGNFLGVEEAEPSLAKPAPAAPSRIPGGRMAAGGRGGTTYAERAALYAYKPPEDELDVLRRRLRGTPGMIRKVERQATKIRNDIERYENTPGYEEYVEGKQALLFNIMKRLGEYESNLVEFPKRIEAIERKRAGGK